MPEQRVERPVQLDWPASKVNDIKRPLGVRFATTESFRCYALDLERRLAEAKEDQQAICTHGDQLCRELAAVTAERDRLREQKQQLRNTLHYVRNRMSPNLDEIHRLGEACDHAIRSDEDCDRAALTPPAEQPCAYCDKAARDFGGKCEKHAEQPAAATKVQRYAKDGDPESGPRRETRRVPGEEGE